MKEYKTIYKNSKSEIEIKKSKFIGNAFVCDSEEKAIEYIEKTNKTFYDATHTAYAYIIIEDTEIQRFSDDGEPSGTAGLPILNFLKRENLKNLLITVTRYYGGIKLGKGGLIRAYSQSAVEAVQNNKIIEKKNVIETQLIISYNLYGGIENFLQNEKTLIKSKDFTDDVTIKILALEKEFPKLKEKLINLTSNNIEIKEIKKSLMSTYNNKIIKEV